MNSYRWQLASWAAGFEDRKPFYLVVIDGESRLGFVNSHFFLQFQQAGSPAESTMMRCLVDERDQRRFDNALATCLTDEKDVLIEVRMRSRQESWVNWELRFLEAVGEGPGRIFCLGFALSGEEVGSEAEVRHCDERLAAQKELMYKKVREAAVHAEQQERERIGHELHDNISQILTSAQLFLGCLDRENEDFDKVKKKTAEILACRGRMNNCGYRSAMMGLASTPEPSGGVSVWPACSAGRNSSGAWPS